MPSNATTGGPSPPSTSEIAMAKERVLVTVKTYPTLSTKYGETVCTAGVRPDGTWVRIYPVPFRRLDEGEQYSKFDWLDLDLVRNTADPRPETFRPTDDSVFEPVGHMDTGKDRQWRERRRLLLGTSKVYTNRDALIADAKANVASLAVFKPTRVIDLVVEADERDWNVERVEAMRNLTRQFDLFSDNRWRETFRLVRKMPWKFSYRFVDDSGNESELQILDWEIGALYWNCLRGANGDEAEALAKVRVKYVDQFLQTDLHLFVGTTQEWHFRAVNPWVIIGVFPIPVERQPSLF